MTYVPIKNLPKRISVLALGIVKKYQKQINKLEKERDKEISKMLDEELKTLNSKQ